MKEASGHAWARPRRVGLGMLLVGSALGGLFSDVADAGRGDPASDGMRLIRQGRYRLAHSTFERVLAEQPEHALARYGLAVTEARSGHCGSARTVLAESRDREFYRIDGFLAEALCMRLDGDRVGAVERLEEAARLAGPRAIEPWYLLVGAYDAVGDRAAAEHALERLAERDRFGVDTSLAELGLAVGTDGFDRVWARTSDIGNAGKLYAANRDYLEGRHNLATGAPESALRPLRRAVRSNFSSMQFGFVRAEALRRTGQLEWARAAVERKAMTTVVPGPIALAIRVRIAVDEGDLATAREELAAHPDPSHPEVIASAWYLARASGNAEAERRLALAFEAVRQPSVGELEYLIPRSLER